MGKIELLLPKRKTRRGRPGLSDREMVNAMLYRAKTGTPWRDLPERYGNWKSVDSRWLRWRDATRYDKRASSYLATIMLAAILVL